MTAYYNEIDPFAAAWLRQLISAGYIAPGDVDERSIVDVRPDDLRKYTQCHFFAGIGVWSYALRRAEWPDDRPIWTGSCPCQPFSAAGKGGGFADERHLWPSFFHLIGECGPPVVAGEQVASKDGLSWLDLVQADMEGTGYAFGAVDTCAAGFGEAHIRSRLYWIGVGGLEHAKSQGRCGRVALEAQRDQKPGGSGPYFRASERVDGFGSISALSVSDVLAPSYGTPGRVGRLRGYGNAINAEQATAFIEAYLDAEADRCVRVEGAFE